MELRCSPVIAWHCTVLPRYQGKKGPQLFFLYSASCLSSWNLSAVRHLTCVSVCELRFLLHAISFCCDSKQHEPQNIHSSSVSFWDILVLLCHPISNKLVIYSPQRTDFPECSPDGRSGSHNSLDTQLILVLKYCGLFLHGVISFSFPYIGNRILDWRGFDLVCVSFGGNVCILSISHFSCVFKVRICHRKSSLLSPCQKALCSNVGNTTQHMYLLLILALSQMQCYCPDRIFIMGIFIFSSVFF